MSVSDQAVKDDLDPRAALRQLGFANPTRIRRLHEGKNSAMWQVTLDDKHYALRILRPEDEEQRQREIAARQRDGMAPFYAWAGTVIEEDLAPPRRTPEELARLRAWTTRWMAHGVS